MRHVSAVRELVQSIIEQDDISQVPPEPEDTGRTKADRSMGESQVNWAAKHIKDHCPLMEKQIAAKHFGHFFHAHVKNFDHKKFRRMAGLKEGALDQEFTPMQTGPDPYDSPAPEPVPTGSGD
jgi:hypothetical protein